MKNRETTNQKYIIIFIKIKKEHKNYTKENQDTKGKAKRKTKDKEGKWSKEPIGKQGLKWQ